MGMRNSDIVVGMINESKQQPQSTQRAAPASAAVATGVFMFLGKRRLQWKERKTLPTLKESGKAFVLKS